ncbi:tetratricopeptide repeat protein [Thiobacillus sp.]
MKLFDFKKKKADRLFKEAQQLDKDGETEASIAKYLDAIACDPDNSASHYNLGLIYKYRGDWQRSFDFNQTANALDPGDEAACWNLAIAATALRNWPVARSKWKENGIDLGEGEGPIEMDFGMTPVRLNPDDDAEVVWATRIDPARARLDSVPFPQSGFHYGDVVLNDGAPVGFRSWNECEYPVFNVLELFEPSVYTTCVVTVTVESDSDLDALTENFSATRSHFEDWTQNTRVLCKACSEGRPHEQHDHELETGWSCERRLGIAIYPGDDIRQILNQWEQSSTGRVVSVESVER